MPHRVSPLRASCALHALSSTGRRRGGSECSVQNKTKNFQLKYPDLLRFNVCGCTCRGSACSAHRIWIISLCSNSTRMICLGFCGAGLRYCFDLGTCRDSVPRLTLSAPEHFACLFGLVHCTFEFSKSLLSVNILHFHAGCHLKGAFSVGKFVAGTFCSKFHF